MASHARARILVVEDEWMLAHSISGVVERLRCEVVGPTGQIADALALARKEPLDAAVLDLNLHGELTYPIAKLLMERGIPVIFLTGYDRDSVLPEYASIPLLEKPFADEDLAAQLRPVMAGAR